VRIALAFTLLVGCIDAEPRVECDSNKVHGVIVTTRGEPASVCVGQTLLVNADSYVCERFIDETASLSWASSATNIATVEAGRVTGVAPGKVTVSASKGQDQGALEVSVAHCADVGVPLDAAPDVADAAPDVVTDSSTDAPDAD
jgi:hypothetical protein